LNTVIISDRTSGGSKDFGFVTMEDAVEANNAVEEMDGVTWLDETLK